MSVNYTFFVTHTLSVLASYLEIISAAPQDSYVKLITSSLPHDREGNCHAVLAKALTAGQEVKM